jgi:lipopolysaccharide export LptBFGC system permease protein LptF
MMQKNMSVDYEESLTIENLENTKQELRKSISHETRQLEQKTSNDALRAKQQIIQKQRKHAQHQTKPPDTRNGTSTWLTLKPHKDSTSEDFHRPTRKISQIHTLNSYNRKDSPPSHKCVYYWVTTCAFMDVLAVSVPSLSFLNTTTRVLSDHNSHTLFCF